MRTRIVVSILGCLLAATVWGSETAKPKGEKPAVSGPGAIRGQVDQPRRVQKVWAVCRYQTENPNAKSASNDIGKTYPGSFDATTGRFAVEKLPLFRMGQDDEGQDVILNGVYDLIIDLGGNRLEGVNLRVPRSDFEEEQPLTAEDRDALKKRTTALNKFEDTHEYLAINGNAQHAAVLVNKLRTKPFYDSKPGEVIWRLEVWRFEKPDESWIKTQNELAIIHYRERMQRAKYDAWKLTLDPAIGGLKLTEKTPTLDVGLLTLPNDQPGIRVRPWKDPDVP